MAAGRAQNRDDASPVSFLVAVAAALLAGLLLASDAVVATTAPEGWFKTFLLNALPGAVVVAGAFAALHLLLSSRGLTRDQQLVSAMASELDSRISGGRGPAQVGFSEADWSALLPQSDQVFGAARSLARWSQAQTVPLTEFFAKGGFLTVVTLDLNDRIQMQRAADDHGGHKADGSPTRVQSNVRAGLRRLRSLADHHPDGWAAALHVRLVVPSSFAFTSGLFVLYRDGAPRQLVLRAHENVRKEVTLGPIMVADLDEPTWREFAAREVQGLTASSRKLSPDEIAVMAGS